jgi:UDP-N-acetylglucosamine diphosphorylase / glucose-1-phosphate thymidylyltransferase / UDP-N-acetylgalactosamine diphosphorylase / glucosamine-1-phosphate N-acetyltransferase / galactosamine-1-phosphate N-acetyltransferase
MKEVIILASGQSSRFWPLAEDRHKCLYPVFNGKTVLFHTLQRLLRSGRKRVIITISPRDMDRVSGEIPRGMDAEVVVQEKPLGQGDALLKASERLKGSRFYVTSPEKIFAFELLGLLEKAASKHGSDEIFVATARTDTPQIYGMVKTDARGRILGVCEKPAEWSDSEPRKIVSAYLLDRGFIDILSRNENEQYSFESALDAYAKDHPVVSVQADSIPETELKYPWHLLHLNRCLMKELKAYRSSKCEIEKGAIIEGAAHIEEGAFIAASAVVRGPCFIGKGAQIWDHALVRDYSYIGAGVSIGAHSEIKNSIVYDGAKLHDSHALDSIIGFGCNMGAGTRVSNTRFDGKPVTSVIKGEKVGTGMHHFGIVLGDGSKTATNANIMPGVKIGRNCRIGGSFDLASDLPNNFSAYLSTDQNGCIKIVSKVRSDDLNNLPKNTDCEKIATEDVCNIRQ